MRLHCALIYHSILLCIKHPSLRSITDKKRGLQLLSLDSPFRCQRAFSLFRYACYIFWVLTKTVTSISMYMYYNSLSYQHSLYLKSFLWSKISLNACRKVIKSFLQGFLPGLALKVFLFVLPAILMFMSKIEGHVALSVLERRTAAKYYYFMLVNVFLGSIVAGTAFQQLHAFLHESATQ